MANFSALKQSIQNYIKQNGNKEITGAILQNILLSMVTTMGDGAINDNASDISDIKGDIQNINGDITNINSSITNINSSITNINSSITNINSSITDINGDITELNGNLSNEVNRAKGAETTTILFSDGKLVFKNAAGTVLYQLSVDSFLSAITTRLNTGALYAGYATPSTTPATLTSQEVFYLATQAGTYTNFHFNGGDDPIVLTKDGIYFIVSGDDDDDWNAEPMLQLDDVPTASSNNAVKSGGVAEELALGAVYDVSAKNPTAGPNNDGKWESLSALFSDANLSTLIPASVRKGGMSIKFVQSSDNKYVQYLYLGTSVASADFTNITNWEKVVLEEKVKYLLSLSKKNEEVFSTILSGADSVSIPICFEIGDICYVKNLSAGACSVYLTDFSGNIVQTVSAGLVQNGIVNFIVEVSTAAKIGGYCSTGYNLEFSIKSPKSLEILSQTTQKINNNLKEQYIYKIPSDVELTLVEDKFIAPSGVVMSGGGEPFHVSNAYQISPNQKLDITASALYGNCYYAIYDENNNVLLRENQTGSVYEKQITVIAPADSHHICISWVGGYTLSSMSVADIILNGKSWSDLKWVCFGDSLTEVNSNAKKKYYNYAQEELGISPLVYGVSGTGYFKNYGAGNNNFLTRIEQLANVDFDIITFFGSFNDLDGGWIGGSIDSTDTTQNDICGFINATLNRLYEIKPFVKVGIITPTPWYNSFTLSECSEYATKLKQIAEKRSLPCLDLFRCSNLHPDKENFRIEFYKEDGVQDNGTHPNSLGHLRIYPQFREFLKSML